MTKQQLIEKINADITTNGEGNITGAMLRNILENIVSAVFPEGADGEVLVASGDGVSTKGVYIEENKTVNIPEGGLYVNDGVFVGGKIKIIGDATVNGNLFLVGEGETSWQITIDKDGNLATQKVG